MVAYRKATIALADTVVHLEGGRVVDQGTHAELLARSPGYAHLVNAYETEHPEHSEHTGEEVAPFLGPRVLEVGAGLGGTTRVFCRGDHNLWEMLEPDPQLAAQAEQLCRSGQLLACCQVRIGTTSDLPVDEAFDAILYIDVLEHIEGDLDEFRRAAGLLSPGGHLIVLSPLC